MKSRTSQILILILIGILLIGGVGYITWRTLSHDGGPTIGREEKHIRSNKTLKGEVISVMQSAQVITIKDTSGQDAQIAIVAETKILDAKNNTTDTTNIFKGSTIEAKGESITADSMIASEIRIIATPEIIVTTPTEDTAITSPLTIEGLAKGTWFFEASFPVEITDAEHRSLGKKFVTATKEWMTESLVPFKGELEFQKPTTKTGYLILRNDNPSGLKENEKSIEIPVTFEPETMRVQVFFNNSKLDPAFLCTKVFPVSREIAWTTGTGRAAIEELLKGPNESERGKSYFTNINTDVKINDLVIENGVAKIDFSSELERNSGGSCRVGAIRAQITETLKQFPTIREVIISINGRVDDILQP